MVDGQVQVSEMAGIFRGDELSICIEFCRHVGINNTGTSITATRPYGGRTARRSESDVESYIEKKIEQTREVERMLKQSTDLDHRQLSLLAHAIRHPDAEYTIQSHTTGHSVAYATARADLFRLAEVGLLEQRRIGRKTFVFRASPSIEKRIRSFAGGD